MQLDKTKVEMLRRVFIDVVQDIRQSFDDANISGFKVEAVASGRTFNGEAKLTFSVCSSEYGNNRVDANDLIAAHVECLRREGFDIEHRALALPAPGTEFEPDQIPY